MDGVVEVDELADTALEFGAVMVVVMGMVSRAEKPRRSESVDEAVSARAAVETRALVAGDMMLDLSLESLSSGVRIYWRVAVGYLSSACFCGCGR